VSKFAPTGLRRLLTSPITEKAADDTQDQLPHLIVRDPLLAWSKSGSFPSVLDEIWSGGRPNIEGLVGSFLNHSSFYVDDDLDAVASAVLRRFISNLRHHLHVSKDGVAMLGNELDSRHSETLAHTTNETQRVIDHLSPKPEAPSWQQNAREFAFHTNRAIASANLEITGLHETLAREEVDLIEDQLRLLRPVLLTGEPGAGKTGIGVLSARRALNEGKAVLYVDSRRLLHLKDETDLRRFYGLSASVLMAMTEVQDH
jgi:hypothetical protein